MIYYLDRNALIDYQTLIIKLENIIVRTHAISNEIKSLLADVSFQSQIVKKKKK